MQPRLIGLRAPVMGLTVNLSPTETTLGREASNTVVINSSSVSRRHARIVPQGNGFAIEDLGSANGVRVNGIMIPGLTPLKGGDTIDLGEISLLFEAPIDHAAAGVPAPTRKPEVSSVERAQQAQAFPPPSQAASSAPGCDIFGNLLNDLSSSLPGLMKYLVWLLLGALALFCLFTVVMMGVGAISQIMAGHGPSASSSGNPAGTPPNQPPSQSQSPPPQTPPPAEDNSKTEETGNAKITILSTRVIRVVGPDQSKTPTLLVKWRNDSDQPVSELDGTVIIHTADGHTDAYPKMRIYSGSPVQPGQEHEDKGASDGVAIATDADPKPEVVPTLVK